MGTFAQLQYEDGGWVERVGIDAELAREPAALRIDIHDSDLAALSWPAEDGLGLLFLGYQPRHYFGDEHAGPQVDVAREAAGLAEWARAMTGAEVDPADVERLAAPDDPDHEPQDVFVEETVGRLLALLGLPLPDLLVT